MRPFVLAAPLAVEDFFAADADAGLTAAWGAGVVLFAFPVFSTGFGVLLAAGLAVLLAAGF